MCIKLVLSFHVQYTERNALLWEYNLECYCSQYLSTHTHTCCSCNIYKNVGLKLLQLSEMNNKRQKKNEAVEETKQKIQRMQFHDYFVVSFFRPVYLLSQFTYCVEAIFIFLF